MSRGDTPQQRSILTDLGEELTAIITPVSICMALTVTLVKVLNPTGASDAHSVFIASAFYTEQDGDSNATKTVGALVNAAAFVVVVTLMTFLLVFLFKRGYTRFIYGYMAFAGFSIFFVLAGILLLQLLETFDVAMDAFSYLFLLYNFAVVGVLGLFVWPAPMALKQAYLTITGVIVAYVFTWTPEWTTWTLLLAMAVYDMFAVLMPGGPLKELVQIAEERQVDIPALVYEARAVRRDSSDWLPEATSDSAWVHRARPRRAHNVHVAPASPPGAAGAQPSEQRQQQADAARHVSEAPEAVHVAAGVFGGQHLPAVPSPEQPTSEREAALAAAHQQRQQVRQRDEATSGEWADEADMLLLPDAIKLGLGDFIFYSVLVGRAAMYDMLCAYIAYLAIVAGLGATLLALALYQKALPALPVSIALGVAFYFATRLLLEPFALGLSTSLVFF